MDSTRINIDIKIHKDTLIKINNENSIRIKYLVHFGNTKKNMQMGNTKLDGLLL
jgi:hypothetical protein